MSRRHLVAAVVAVVVTLLLPSPGARAGEGAIHPSNRPTPVPDETNGRVRPESLVTVEAGCRAARPAGPSLALMLAAARADGVALVADDCYRPRDDQAAAHNRSCRGGNCACAAPAGSSFHGWGKAVDFDDAGGTLRFSSEGYRWMKAHAGRYGWNHPGWAEPGGSRCPEAWHWEWVGDGGNMGLEPVRADVVGALRSPGGRGYWVLGGLGGVTARGDAPVIGSAAEIPLHHLVKGGAATPQGAGYWLVASDGGVFAFGDAPFAGSLGATPLNRPVVGMAGTATGRGYWLVASDGGVFAFGDAPFLGSLGASAPDQPVVGLVATPDGGGYWLVAADGRVFPFGDAVHRGEASGRRGPGRVVAMATTPSGRGYWLACADGAVIAFGDAVHHGDAAGLALNLPVVGLTTRADGAGYWLVAADGGVFAFGSARFHGPG